MTTKTITAINVLGRRWFQKTYGNTYNTAEVFIYFADGSTEYFKIPFGYGYGDQYAQRAEKQLELRGYMPGREQYANGSAQPAWQYFRDDRGINYTYQAIDVARKRDL